IYHPRSLHHSNQQGQLLQLPITTPLTFKQKPSPVPRPIMRFSSTTTSFALTAFVLPLFATAQDPPETICEMYIGSAYADGCCSTLLSRGPTAPCADIAYVANATLCTIEDYPTGWAVCVEKNPVDAQARDFAYAPSGSFNDSVVEEWGENVAWAVLVMGDQGVGGRLAKRKAKWKVLGMR
ncbi:hypothetical protein EJ02DRAFT_488100, partial [Clathrospora elynae]